MEYVAFAFQFSWKLIEMEFYSVSARPFYNSLEQCYLKVLQIDRQPPQSAAINAILKRVTFSRLSPFDVPGSCEKVDKCGYVLMNPDNLSVYATNDDIPLIFTWLLQNGYVVNTAITDMLNGSKVKATYPLLCMITK